MPPETAPDVDRDAPAARAALLVELFTNEGIGTLVVPSVAALA